MCKERLKDIEFDEVVYRTLFEKSIKKIEASEIPIQSTSDLKRIAEIFSSLNADRLAIIRQAMLILGEPDTRTDSKLTIIFENPDDDDLPNEYDPDSPPVDESGEDSQD